MEITVNLPEDIVEGAQAEGLLDDRRLADVLRAEITRVKAARRLGQMVAAIHAVEPPLTEAEIQAELDARKADRLAQES
jgi:hypothetical protein